MNTLILFQSFLQASKFLLKIFFFNFITPVNIIKKVNFRNAFQYFRENTIFKCLFHYSGIYLKN